MPEEDTLKTLDESLNTLKDSSPKSKDYCKFIISLATGTLVFSMTFLKQFEPSPEYKIILVIGWLCLLANGEGFSIEARLYSYFHFACLKKAAPVFSSCFEPCTPLRVSPRNILWDGHWRIDPAFTQISA